MLIHRPIPTFVELCAGTAAVSLRLAKAKAKPPVSRMGAKTGYADAILYHLRLQPGQGAERYVWCEPDDGARLLLGAYTDPELCREAAGILRSWAGEEPRALWDRLRGEAVGVGAREVARWLWVQGHRDARGSCLAPQYARPEGNADGQWKAPPRDWLVRRLLRSPTCPATIHPDARLLDPIPGAVVLFDPPYVNTTGYGHDLPRPDVVAIAERWAAAGCTVAICEQEPIAELPTWERVEIGGLRRGQVRTFSKQKSEWLTIWRGDRC